MSNSVSVIIPTFNRAGLVDRCLQSLRRSQISDLEIIVVDDGGTDETPDVAAKHGAKFIRQANAGPAAARNAGFEASQGRYVAFIDSDDEWLGGGARRLAAQLDDNPDVELIFADSLMGNEEDGFVSFVRTYGTDTFYQLPYWPRPHGVRVFERRPFFLQLSTRNVMFLGSLLVRRDFFDRIGRFDRELRGAADWDFFMRATAAGAIAFSEGSAVSRYYKHDAGMSTDRDHMEDDFIRALDSVRRRSVLDPIEYGHVANKIREHLFGWAWEAYDRGDLVTARERLSRSRELGEFGTREAMYFAATFLPQALLTGLRRARSKASG